ncbi:hypothetical protein BpHYR1_023076, partial [Brachionus plicatilis]
SFSSVQTYTVQLSLFETFSIFFHQSDDQWNRMTLSCPHISLILVCSKLTKMIDYFGFFRKKMKRKITHFDRVRNAITDEKMLL